MIPKLSLIIVNYRSEDVLEHCLRSVHVATDDSVEVILVDNSAERGADEVLNASGLEGRYFPQADNIGYTRAANLGAQHATGEYLCFLNPDTILHAHALDRMLDWLEQHPRTVVGPRELDNRDRINTTVFPFVTRRHIWGVNLLYKLPWRRQIHPWLGWLIPPFHYAQLCRTADRPVRVPVLSGSGLMLRRQAWEEIGEWNPELTYFGLESEWFARAKDAGVSAWYIPIATMYHEHSLSINRSHGGHVRAEADANRRWHARRMGWLTLVILGWILSVEYRLRPR